jgi:hypothetical protein
MAQNVALAERLFYKVAHLKNHYNCRFGNVPLSVGQQQKFAAKNVSRTSKNKYQKSVADVDNWLPQILFVKSQLVNNERDGLVNQS